MALSRQTHVYERRTDVALELDIYVPDRLSASGGALLWLHGGALIMGSRADVRDDVLRLADHLGVTLVSPDYRLAPQATLPAIVADVTAAWRWLRSAEARLGIDAAHVVAAGESAGAYLALLLGTLDPAPCAVLAYNGYGTLDSPWYMSPSEEYCATLAMVDRGEAFASVGDRVVANGHERPDAWKYYLYSRQHGLWPEMAAGFDPRGMRGELRRYSPTYLVTGDFPPTMLLHGTCDYDVPHAESVALSSLLALHDVEHEFLSLEGFDHGLAPGDDPRLIAMMERATEGVRAFLTRHLETSQ